MNIAYIIPKIIKQGPVLVIHEIVLEMVNRGHECTVYYFDDTEDYKDNVQQFSCPTRRIKMTDSLPWDEIDVIHSHSWRAEIYICLHLRAIHRHHVRSIATIHELSIYDWQRSEHGELYSRLFTSFHHSLLKKVDLRVVLSKQAMMGYKKYFKERPMTYIYNSRTIDPNVQLNDEEKKELLEFKGDSILLGINALLTTRKAVDVAIDSLKVLKELELNRGKSYKLFIAGSGPALEDLKEQAKKLNVENRILFAGYRVDAFRYIPYYDIYLMPSRSEGFPMALLEAMALHCNAVISDIPIFKEFFTEKEMTYFHLDDAKDMSEAIVTATMRPKGHEAYQKYIACYSPHIFGNQYEAVYKGSNNPHED